MIYKVIIKRSHIYGILPDGTIDDELISKQYTSIEDCPLARAIKEQLPNFPPFTVSGGGIITERNAEGRHTHRNFVPTKGNRWDSWKLEQFIKSDKEEYQYEFTEG